MTVTKHYERKIKRRGRKEKSISIAHIKINFITQNTANLKL